jgi:small subunit ribosomal protein S8e
MGINRDSIYKRRSTGGSQTKWRKKRKGNMGRQPAMTKLTGEKRIHIVRARGGHLKFRALRMDSGNFSWPGEGVLCLLVAGPPFDFSEQEIRQPNDVC